MTPRDGSRDHYCKCAAAGCESTAFAVVRDGGGEIVRFECAACGGRSIVEGPSVG